MQHTSLYLPQMLFIFILWQKHAFLKGEHLFVMFATGLGYFMTCKGWTIIIAFIANASQLHHCQQHWLNYTAQWGWVYTSRFQIEVVNYLN